MSGKDPTISWGIAPGTAHVDEGSQDIYGHINPNTSHPQLNPHLQGITCGVWYCPILISSNAPKIPSFLPTTNKCNPQFSANQYH